MNRGKTRDSGGDSRGRESDIEDLLEDLEELEDIVDTPEERDQVRETMQTARRVRGGRVYTGFKSAFDSRDVGEALVGSFIVGIPMIVEDGTLDVGRYIAGNMLYFGLTVFFGLALTVGILHAARFEEIEADMLFGFVPLRLISLLAISSITAVGLMTIWGRVDWTTPQVALGQVTVTAMVMTVGAAIGDILPE